MLTSQTNRHHEIMHTQTRFWMGIGRFMTQQVKQNKEAVNMRPFYFIFLVQTWDLSSHHEAQHKIRGTSKHFTCYVRPFFKQEKEQTHKIRQCHKGVENEKYNPQSWAIWRLGNGQSGSSADDRHLIQTSYRNSIVTQQSNHQRKETHKQHRQHSHWKEMY